MGITIASVPSLRPLFRRILDITSQRSDSSGRNFQKINGRERGVQVQISSRANARNTGRTSLRRNDGEITKTTELRMSTETDIEFAQLSKPPSAWGAAGRDRPLAGYISSGVIV